MKPNNTHSLAALLTLLFTSCTLPTQKENQLITFDISGSYSTKEINMEEVADVEYIRIKENNDFLYKGSPMAITEKHIVIYDQAEGSILFYLRDGTPLSKFNHKGNGQGEYPSTNSMIYDSKADELFVKTPNAIQVYSSTGDYKRTLKFPPESFIRDIAEADDTHLLVSESNGKYPSYFTLISKQDGTIADSIAIPKGDDRPTYIVQTDNAGSMSIFMGNHKNIIKYRDGVLLNNHSLDTAYYYKPNHSLRPVLVRTPSTKSLSPFIYHNGFIEGGEYQFLQTVTVEVVEGKLPSTFLMRQKNTGKVYQQKIVLADYAGKTFTLSQLSTQRTGNAKLGFIELELTELKQANENRQLSGKLKMLVDCMNDEENNVIMLLKLK